MTHEDRMIVDEVAEGKRMFCLTEVVDAVRALREEYRKAICKVNEVNEKLAEAVRQMGDDGRELARLQSVIDSQTGLMQQLAKEKSSFAEQAKQQGERAANAEKARFEAECRANLFESERHKFSELLSGIKGDFSVLAKKWVDSE